MTGTGTNTRVTLAHRPTGDATPDCFAIDSEPLAPLEAGEVRVRVDYLSIDAGLRTMLRGEGFHQQVGVGEVVRAGGVGTIVETAADGWDVGQAVRGNLGAQTFANRRVTSLERIDVSDVPISAYLGVLGGSTGVTAWVGVRCVAKPQPGDVFVVSAAAGAVGSIAGQIAKRDGATVVGIAGGEAKTAHLTDTLGFDAAIDYKSEDVTERLRELAPEGVKVFFDNVGGAVLDAVLAHLAMHARVVICGAVSQYNDMDHVVGPSNYLKLAERQSRMEGFAYFHFPDRLGEAAADLAAWLADGSLVMTEHVLEGVERFPEALQFMFSGGNIGKLLVKCS
jgi:NADPH-dependent curcumin reductase CurA